LRGINVTGCALIDTVRVAACPVPGLQPGMRQRHHDFIREKTMKKTFAALTTAAALILAAPALTTPAQAQDDVDLVTILTAPDAQTQLMAMVLTMQSIQAGASAHILLCGPAADMALQDAPESATAPQEPRGMSPQGLMRTIMEQTGTEVEVCAIYLPNKGVGEEALIEGVTAANPAVMGERLVAPNARIMSF